MGGFAGIYNDPVLFLIALAIVAVIATMFLAIVAPRIQVGGLRDILRLFVGVKVPPLLVAWIRRAVTFVIGLLVLRFGSLIGMDELKDKVIAGAIAASVVEFLWGLLDQIVKSDQNARNPPPVAGGAPEALAQDHQS